MSSSESNPPPKPPKRAKKQPQQAKTDGPKPERKPPPEPREGQQSVRDALASIRNVAEVNKLTMEANANTMRAIAGLENKLKNVARDKKIEAANFGPGSALVPRPRMRASNFGASDFSGHDLAPMLALLHEHGLTIPCSTFEETMAMLLGVIRGELVHPKRFAPYGKSLVITSTADQIFTIPPSGTGGFTSGNTIVIVTPGHSSYKGVLVFAVDGVGNWQVLKYVAPDRDPETTSTLCAVLFSRLSASAPSIITGTAVTLGAQYMIQSGVVDTVFGLKSGKMASLVNGGISKIVPMGPQTFTLCNFTATDPEDIVKRYTPFDPQNQALVNVPNGAFLGANSSVFPYPEAPFTVNATFADYNTAVSSGYSTAVAAAVATGGFKTIGTGTTQTLWSFADSSDALRKVPFGDVEITASFDRFVSTNAFIIQALLRVILDNGNGTTSNLDWSFPMYPGQGGIMNLNVDTRGAGQYSGNRGACIRDIQLIYDNSLGSATEFVGTDPNNPINMRVVFLDVPAEEVYLVHSLTGVQSGINLAVGLNCHTEVELDRTASNSTFLTATRDLAYDPYFITAVLRAHLLTNDSGENAFSAASWMNTAKKILHYGGKVGKALGGVLPGPVGGLANTIGEAAGAASGAIHAKTQRSMHAASFTELCPACDRDIVDCTCPPHIDEMFENCEASCCTESGVCVLRALDCTRSRCHRQMHAMSFPTKPSVPRPLPLSTAELNKLSEQGKSARSEALRAWAMFDLAALDDFGELEESREEPPETPVSPPVPALPTAPPPEQRILLKTRLPDGTISWLPLGEGKRFTATVFGPPAVSKALPKFFYPAITDGGEGPHTFAIIPVVPNGAVDGVIKAAIPEASFGCLSKDIKGRSGTLAILLANLDQAGFPVRPGTLSGEVKGLRVFRAGNHPKGQIVEVTFDLLPVAGGIAKRADAEQASEILMGMFPDGWYDGDTTGAFRPDNIFPPSKVRVEAKQIPSPQGYEGDGYHINAWVLGL